MHTYNYIVSIVRARLWTTHVRTYEFCFHNLHQVSQFWPQTINECMCNSITNAARSQNLYTVKKFGLLQPYFGHLGCMPVVYVTHYKTSKQCFLIESKLNCSWEASLSNRIFLWKPIAIWLHSWHFYHNHATKALLQEQMCRIKETPTSSEML